MPVKKWYIISRKNGRKLINFGKFLLLIILFAGLILAVVFLFKSDLIRIKKITCLKNDFPCEKEIVFFEDLKGKSLLATDFNYFFKSIKDTIPEIETIRFSRRLPDEIIIKIFTRQPLTALTSSLSSWYLVDTNGFVYKQVLTKPLNIPEIRLMDPDYGIFLGQFITDESVKKVILLVKELKANFTLYREIQLNSPNTITVFLQEDIIASFSGQKAIKNQVDSLQFILRQSKIEGKLPTSIDLRFVKPVIRY